MFWIQGDKNLESLHPVLAGLSLQHYSLFIVSLVSGSWAWASLFRGLYLWSLTSYFSGFRK
jgi:hypothetical protein